VIHVGFPSYLSDRKLRRVSDVLSDKWDKNRLLSFEPGKELGDEMTCILCATSFVPVNG